MTNYQSGIFEDIPTSARYQFFRLKPGKNPVDALKALADFAVEHNVVVGLGQSLLSALDVDVPGMRKMPEFAGKGVETPSTPFSLWCWIRGEDRGDLLHKARKVRHLLTETFTLEQVCDAFKFADSRDLTGYEDGTENPDSEDAIDAAFVASDVKGLAGSSFVAVQQWLHDLDQFQSMPRQQQDHTIGRDQETNEELDEAPESAHVKRAEQEAFSPEAYMLRRSMPWANEEKEGLVFVAFGKSFDAFEAVMQRMVGMDDGIVDALFTFTQPLTGSYFWCPPIKEGKLDLSYVLK